jgi:hypothetical protein
MENQSFYVYTHHDLSTREIVYIGKGKHGRAWDVTRSRNTHKEHQEWMLELCKKGWVPSDWVQIVATGLTEKEAFDIEKRMLHKNGTTRFNRQGGEKNHQAKLTNEQAREIFLRCKAGENHTKLSLEYGVCRPAISMIATRRQWKTVTVGL